MTTTEPDAGASEAAAVDDLLARLTYEEKVGLLAGCDTWHLAPIDRLGIGSVRMTDGPAGARGPTFAGGPTSANVPCATALAATWDPPLVEEVGRLLGREARRKGAHVLLAPTVNLHRSPLGGRSFECMSEDPLLTSLVAMAYVRGVQGEGVAACVKHFVANDQETDRMEVSAEVGERALRELYLAPFHAALVHAGAWAVMSAYNRVNGVFASEHRELLTDVLRRDWGWDGTVVSDWWGTRSAASLAAGLDVEMPGPGLHRPPGSWWDADDMDRAARRVLLLARRTGAAGARSAPEPEQASGDDPADRALLRRAAAAGTVLLRNEGGLLPLAAGVQVALIGPNADHLFALGGGSAGVSVTHVVSPLEGLRDAGVDVTYEQGCAIPTSLARLDPRHLDGGGLEVEYLVDGEVRRTATVPTTGLVWSAPPVEGVGRTAWTARVSGTWTPPVTGTYRISLRGRNAGPLSFDGEVVLARGVGTVDLVAGRPVHLSFPFTPGEGVGPLIGCELRAEPPMAEDGLARAVAAAAAADVAVVVVGLDGELETEGRDRTTMDLPSVQDDLVRAVLAANPKTVVVVNSGSPVTMPWADDVPALLQLFCPGQEGGAALADVLTGAAEPGGRLPTTLPRRIEDTPAFPTWPGEHGRSVYGEGLFIGYRWYQARDIEPAFAFGHGLGYTTFEVGPVALTSTADGIGVAVDVTNTGSRAGKVVLQAYLHEVDCPVQRPPLELKRMVQWELKTAETIPLQFTIGVDDLATWDPPSHAWQARPGRYEVAVGFSSADLRRREAVTWTGPA